MCFPVIQSPSCLAVSPCSFSRLKLHSRSRPFLSSLSPGRSRPSAGVHRPPCLRYCFADYLILLLLLLPVRLLSLSSPSYLVPNYWCRRHCCHLSSSFFVFPPCPCLSICVPRPSPRVVLDLVLCLQICLCPVFPFSFVYRWRTSQSVGGVNRNLSLA